MHHASLLRRSESAFISHATAGFQQEREMKRSEITTEFCKALIGGKPSGEERIEEEGRGSKVTVLACARVCRWKCWSIVALVGFYKDTQEIRQQ